jgi:Fe-S cluster assembly protein SufD
MSSTLIEPETAVTPATTAELPRPAWDQRDLPTWFIQRQHAAWESYQQLPNPKRKDEAWRFADVTKMALGGLHYALPLSETDARAAATRSVGLARTAAKVVVGNDQMISLTPALPAGLTVLPLMEALRTHAELIEKHFMAQPATLGGEKYYALHAAALRGGVFIHVAAGVELADPVEVHQWIGGIDAMICPHLLIIAEKNARLTVLDYCQSMTSEPGFSLGVTDLAAADGAAINYIQCQRWSRKARSQHFCTTTAGRDAQVKSGFIHLGASAARTESFCLAAGEGSTSEMLALVVAEGTQEIDCRTRQIHRQPHTHSDLLYKNVLFDQARTIFSGLIYVEEGAHYTDAYQTCRSLLLSDEAESNSMPGLEINADQVKCSHGATAGPLRDEEIFYLRSRGLTEPEARQLLAFGFCLEVLEKIKHPEIEAIMSSMVEEKFRRLKS